MSENSGNKSNPALLSRLMDLSGAAADTWDSQELAAMLRHQLSAPLALALGSMGAELKKELQRGRITDPPGSLGELFRQEKPPVPVLELAKRFAKRCRTDPESPMPHGIALLLYYACIVAALTRHSLSISDLADDSLKRGLKWGCAQSWVDPSIRALLEEGLAHLDKKGQK